MRVLTPSSESPHGVGLAADRLVHGHGDGAALAHGRDRFDPGYRLLAVGDIAVLHPAQHFDGRCLVPSAVGIEPQLGFGAQPSPGGPNPVDVGGWLGPAHLELHRPESGLHRLLCLGPHVVGLVRRDQRVDGDFLVRSGTGSTLPGCLRSARARAPGTTGSRGLDEVGSQRFARLPGLEVGPGARHRGPGMRRVFQRGDNGHHGTLGVRSDHFEGRTQRGLDLQQRVAGPARQRARLTPAGMAAGRDRDQEPGPETDRDSAGDERRAQRQPEGVDVGPHGCQPPALVAARIASDAAMKAATASAVGWGCSTWAACPAPLIRTTSARGRPAARSSATVQNLVS